MNRFWQIKDTLIKNLEDNYEDSEFIEFILVDFNSTDGLNKFIIENLKKYFKDGYLKYYFTNKFDNWNAPITRNTTHIIANGDILVNLDADNYTGYRGGKFILDNFKNNERKIFIHQGQGIFGKGNSGRICYYKEDFLKLGGYNEDFMPMGYLDSDLINRFVAYGFKRINIQDEEYSKAIPNNKNDSIKNCKSGKSWMKMCIFNRNLSNKNISENKLIANRNKKIGLKGKLYFYK
jgi:predicted glycosyltransferase involved in capsule biosynthesis